MCGLGYSLFGAASAQLLSPRGAARSPGASVEAGVPREQRGLGPRLEAEFGEDARHVRFRRADGDAEAPRDVAVRRPAADLAEQFELAFREPGRRDARCRLAAAPPPRGVARAARRAGEALPA